MERKPSADVLHGGIPVDAFGGPTVDPTRNVLDLVDAAVRRQDDLRQANATHIEEKLTAFEGFIKDFIAAYDKRYEQRYEASQKALEAALVAQKDAVKEAFAAQKEAINAALASADRAVSKAEVASEKRFEGVNEFRAQLGDQQRTLMPRAEAENRLGTLAEKVGILESFRTEMLSRGTGTKEGYGWAVGIIGFVLTILAVLGAVITLVSKM